MTLVKCPECGERGSIVRFGEGKRYFKINHGSNQCYLGANPDFSKIRKYELGSPVDPDEI